MDKLPNTAEKLSFQRKFEVKTAILIDGGFYRKRANILAGTKSPKDRADELERYCLDHLRDRFEKRRLYRIFYYDCVPLEKQVNVYHPLTKKNVKLGESEEGEWMRTFLDELRHRRKFALRLGRLGTKGNHSLSYNLKPEITKELLSGKRELSNLTEKDFVLNSIQKGVDMRIGVDISSMAFKQQVNQIVLIAGDSDFVPAAKQARREGIDFILDPMHNHIPEDLYEHIDGIRSQILKDNKKNTRKKQQTTQVEEDSQTIENLRLPDV